MRHSRNLAREIGLVLAGKTIALLMIYALFFAAPVPSGPADIARSLFQSLEPSR